LGTTFVVWDGKSITFFISTKKTCNIFKISFEILYSQVLQNYLIYLFRYL